MKSNKLNNLPSQWVRLTGREKKAKEISFNSCQYFLTELRTLLSMAFKAPNHCPNPFFRAQTWLYLGLAQNLSCLLGDCITKLRRKPQTPAWLCFSSPPQSPLMCLLHQHHRSPGSQIRWRFHIALPLYVQVPPPGILSTLEHSSILETFGPCREQRRAKSSASSRPDTG